MRKAINLYRSRSQSQTLTPSKSRQLLQVYFLVRVSSIWIFLPALASTIFSSVA